MKEKMKKLSQSTFIVILLGAFILTIVALFNWICLDGAKDVAAVVNAKDSTVTLEATITSSESYVEFDEGTEKKYWHENVSYTYDGKEYSGVYYNRTERKPEIGKVVTVKIDSKNPGELLPDKLEFLLCAILSPIFLACVTIVLYFIIINGIKRILTVCGKQKESLAKTLALLFIGSKMVIESIVFYNNHNSAVFAVFSLIAALSLYFFVLRKSNNLEKESNTQNV